MDPTGTESRRRGPRRLGPRRRRWRRRLVVVAAALVLVGAVLSVPGVPGHDQAALSAELVASDAGAVATKADPFAATPAPRSCAGLESAYGTANHLFKETDLAVFYASIWPSFQGLDQLYVASLPGADGTDDRAGGQVAAADDPCYRDFAADVASIDANYWDRSRAGLPAAYDQGPRPFHIDSDLPRVDDSLWMGLALMADEARTPSPAVLQRAQAVFDLAVAEWAPGTGGVYWEESGAGGEERAVVSNAPAALLGVELYLRTGRYLDLSWAERIYGWLTRTLTSPGDGLLDDHVDRDGGRTVVDPAIYTYTQGIMLGAMVALAAADPTKYPLEEAVALARRAMDYFAAHRSYGNPGFDAIWAENVLGLAGRYGDPRFTDQARASVRRAIAAEPADPGDLLDASGEATLRELARLPPSRYGGLLFTLPASP